MTLAIGDKVPDFHLPATSNKDVVLSALQGWHVILYFYPKDSTPGCTLEGQQFRDMMQEFTDEKCLILGVSRDSLKSHENFKKKECFPFELVSDENEELCKLFDVIKMKNMYGKQVQGIERSTFLIDKDGVLRNEWRKVKVDGHAEAVLFATRQLNK
ncbi:MAG: peroxiredoxin [Moraxellaceae bacterium]|jgi:peroxiredoxin Q/BCP|nr:peroxiredoxin [Moraxellaceae bacterium]